MSSEGVGTEMEGNDKTCVGLDLKIPEEPKAFLADFEGSRRMDSSTKYTFPSRSTHSLPMSTSTRTSTHGNFRGHSIFARVFSPHSLKPKRVCKKCVLKDQAQLSVLERRSFAQTLGFLGVVSSKG